jgi:hypothetical protein
MYKMLHKAYMLLSNIHKYSNIRTYVRNGNKYQLMCCNAFNNKCECVYTCKNLEPTKVHKYIEELFKCEITNKPKKPGSEDCNCEFTCMIKKSETQLIHDNSDISKKQK